MLAERTGSRGTASRLRTASPLVRFHTAHKLTREAIRGPLIVPLTLLKHHLSRYPVPDWVHQQVYLHPYPKELMLRNHV